MKKFRILLCSILSVVLLLATSCGKDDDSTSQSVADELVGTYVGKLDLYTPGGGLTNHFDAEIILTKTGSGSVNITPKSNTAYSTLAVKNYTGLQKQGPLIISTIGSPTGYITFDTGAKSLMTLTMQTGTADVWGNFVGVRK